MSTTQRHNETDDVQTHKYTDYVSAEDCICCCTMEDGDRIIILDCCSTEHRKELLGVSS